MTLDELLAQLKEQCGDDWITVAALRWAQMRNDEDSLSATEYKLFLALDRWLTDILAAGVQATEQPGGWEPVPIRELIRLPALTPDGFHDIIQLPNDLRLCRLVQRPAAGEVTECDTQ